jgi:hypothetical protein
MVLFFLEITLAQKFWKLLNPHSLGSPCKLMEVLIYGGQAGGSFLAQSSIIVPACRPPTLPP